MPVRVDYPERRIAVVTIDNEAKRNAMSRAMLAEIAALWDELDASDCRAVVLTGAGNRAFSAGADISGDLSASEETAAMINRALLKTLVFSKPLIAAVNGVCAGGGLEFMLGTDIRYAAPHARFGLPEVKWAIYPFGGSTAKLVQQIGYVHAMRLLLTAEMIDAAEAARIGLVNAVVPAGELVDRALADARTIAANSPLAVQAVKRHVAEGAALAVLAREQAEQTAGDRVRASSDFAEGVAAFRAKRLPDYG